MNWLTSPSGTLYTEPRSFTIEPLRNGLYRLYQYGAGLSSLHPTLEAAKKAARS